MNPPSLQELIEAARAYEQLFVPALLREWAPRVAAAARIRPGDKVLDVACGTGVLAREVAARAGASGAVVGLDVNPGMLAVAAEQSSPIEWRQATAESLPFEDRSFDAVVSQFGLMFFSDKQQALREMLRVLNPGGRLALAVWDSLDSAPAFAAEVDLLERVAGRPAADALRAPFLLGDRQGLVDLFTGAGVGSISIATHRGRARFASLRILVEADLRGWLPAMGVVLPEELILRILAEAEHALASYVTAEGTIDFDVSAHIVSATRSDSPLW